MNNTNQFKHITPKELLLTGTTMPKASIKHDDYLYDEDGDGKDITVNYSFMLSGDFLIGDCNAGEIDFYAVYEPLSDDEYADYGSGLVNPEFCVCSAAENEIYDLIEEYKHGVTPKGVLSFERVENMGEKVYFKASVYDRGGRILCFYAMDRGSTYTNNYIGIIYNDDLIGTPLEKKLMSELDEAVISYREEIAER